jgi:ubiquinone/menaquinone biosynthesis C-methylase UbiE
MRPDEYKRASLAVWQAVAGSWDERHAYMERVARPVTERLIERLAPKPGDTILELAGGTGVVGLTVAIHLQGRGQVLVSDFAEPMVEAARRHGDELSLANVEYRVLDAENLDLPDDSFDGVVCRWGYMLMPEPGKALAETRRVLTPGGRLSCAVFGRAEDNPWASVPAGVLIERGHMPPPEAGAPGILALGDPSRLRRMVAEAGFSDPQLDEVTFAWTFASEDDYWQFLTEVAGAISMMLGRLDEDERRDVRAHIAERVAQYGTADGGLALPATCLVASTS